MTMRSDHQRERAALRKQIQQIRYALAMALVALLVQAGHIQDPDDLKHYLER